MKELIPGMVCATPKSLHGNLLLCASDGKLLWLTGQDKMADNAREVSRYLYADKVWIDSLSPVINVSDVAKLFDNLRD